MKGKRITLLPRAKHKLNRQVSSERSDRKGATTRVMVPKLRLEELQTTPQASQRITLLRTKRIECIPSIEVNTNLNRLRNDCFARSVRLAPKSTTLGFQQELMKSYQRHLGKILTIQRFWRRCSNKKRLKSLLEERRLERQRKKKLGEKQKELLRMKQAESQKWKRAAELLEKGSVGSLNIQTVMKQIKLLFDPQSQQCNPEEQWLPKKSSILVIDQKEAPIGERPFRNKVNDTPSQPPTKPLEFKFYQSDSPAVSSQQSAVAATTGLVNWLIEDFCVELQGNHSLFNRMFTRELEELERSQQHHEKFGWDHINQCTDLFFGFIRKFCLKQFMRRFSQPYGLTPILSLKSIRGAIEQGDMRQHNLNEQPMDDEMLFMLSQFIAKRFRRSQFDSPTNSQNGVELDNTSQDNTVQSTNINCVLTAVMELLGIFKPFGSNGKPPLELTKRFPTRSFERLQIDVKRQLQNYYRISVSEHPRKSEVEKAFFEDLDKEQRDCSAQQFEILYIIALDITEGIFWEASHQLRRCFQR